MKDTKGAILIDPPAEPMSIKAMRRLMKKSLSVPSAPLLLRYNPMALITKTGKARMARTTIKVTWWVEGGGRVRGARVG